MDVNSKPVQELLEQLSKHGKVVKPIECHINHFQYIGMNAKLIKSLPDEMAIFQIGGNYLKESIYIMTEPENCIKFHKQIKSKKQ